MITKKDITYGESQRVDARMSHRDILVGGEYIGTLLTTKEGPLRRRYKTWTYSCPKEAAPQGFPTCESEDAGWVCVITHSLKEFLRAVNARRSAETPNATLRLV